MPDKSWTEHPCVRGWPRCGSVPRAAEIIEELSQHLDERYEELRASGAEIPPHVPSLSF